MSQTYRTFSQLINQDQKFLNQLQSFMSMLINSKVFEPSSTPVPTAKQLSKRSLKALPSVHTSHIVQNQKFSHVPPPSVHPSSLLYIITYIFKQNIINYFLHQISLVSF